MFDLDFIQQNQQALAAVFAQNPWLFGLAFFALYVLVTAASLPFATPLTLLAGALFGLVPGVLLVSFASSIGATLAMLISRYALSSMVLKRFGAHLERINQGIKKEGGFYLFSLRLTPAIPFFMINLLMGLTQMRVLTFYWVSQLGMLALTVVYVNAGVQLVTLRHLADIASPAILVSLFLAGTVPLLLKKLMPWIGSKRAKFNIYKPWRSVRPKTFDRNVIVIGAGAGGLVCAYIAAAVKAQVTLVEAQKMGGDCLNYGCVPSKTLIKSAAVAHQMRHASRYGLQDTAAPLPFKSVMARVRAVIAAIEPHDSVERYTQLGVEVLQGYAKILNPWTVEISFNKHSQLAEKPSTTRLTARSIVIAAGSAPVIPPLLGIEDSGYLTSDTLWDAFAKLDEIPQNIVVLGGGPIGCELAQALQRLGAQVTQIELADRLLTREDPQVSAAAKAALETDGVRVLTEHRVLRFVQAGLNRSLVVTANGLEETIAYDALICAVGRAARLNGYGLEALGIDTNAAIETNAYLQTLYPNIYAAGDVTGPYQLTHAAAHQGWYAAVNALFGDIKKFKINYSIIPAAIFIAPEIARVGLNELEALAKGIAYEVTQYDLDGLDRAITDSVAHGFVKVLTAPGKDKILGVTIVGHRAAEMLSEYVLAMQHGLGLNKILATVHLYPSFSQANQYAAGQWKRAHQPTKLLALAQRFHAWRRA